jgi:hypothetical protein
VVNVPLWLADLRTPSHFGTTAIGELRGCRRFCGQVPANASIYYLLLAPADLKTGK